MQPTFGPPHKVTEVASKLAPGQVEDLTTQKGPELRDESRAPETLPLDWTGTKTVVETRGFPTLPWSE